MKGIGNDLVREARRRRGLTQTQLAERAETTQSAIARLESGRTSPSFDDILRLLRLMDLDLDLMLVERDRQDWWQAREALDRSPVERFDHHAASTASLRRLRSMGEAGRERHAVG
jgi:transcriptional regulator with XRE-family HTH domain